MFHFQGMSSGIIKALILGFCFVCLLFWSFFKKKKRCIRHWYLHACIILSFLLSSVPSFLLFLPPFLSSEPQGLLFTFCCLSHHSKCRAFFWQALKQGNEKWLTQFSSSSFSLALLLSSTCTPRPHVHTHTHTYAHVHAHRLHALSQMISEVSPQWKDTQICKVVKGFLSMSTLHDIQCI